jgi:hypothetical protein
MTCDAYKTGFCGEGTPMGPETALASNRTYVTGNSKAAAILIVHDIFGWKLPNTRLLADHYAQETNPTVHLPDL